MNSDELILVTGATGFLGVQLVRELLERQPTATLALLIRDRAGQSGQQRADSIYSRAASGRVFRSSREMSASPTADWMPPPTGVSRRRRRA